MADSPPVIRNRSICVLRPIAAAGGVIAGPVGGGNSVIAGNRTWTPWCRMDAVQELAQVWQALVGRHSSSPLIDEVGRALLDSWSGPPSPVPTSTTCVTSSVTSTCSPTTRTTPTRCGWRPGITTRFRGAPDDEGAACQAEADLTRLGVAADFVAEVVRLVRMTAGHNPATATATPRCSPTRTWPHGAARRAVSAQFGGHPLEFAHVPDEVFRSGRAAIIAALLAANSLYRTPAARDRWEAAARANPEGRTRRAHRQLP